MAEEKKTHVQDQGGFEGRRRGAHQDGFEGRHKAVPPVLKKVEEKLLDYLCEFRERVNSMLCSVQRVAVKISPPDEVLINTGQTAISIATTTKPQDPEVLASATAGQTGYDRVVIFNEVNRLSNKIWVINDGPGTLFAVATSDAIKWSGESEIFPGEFRAFYNVYEVRVRSNNANTKYRVTEYEPILQGNVNSIITPISINSAGDNTIIVASAGKKYRIVKLILVCNAAVSITLKSGANSLTGAMPFAANGGLALDDDVHPFDCNTGEAFIITLSGAVQVSGWSQHLEAA